MGIFKNIGKIIKQPYELGSDLAHKALGMPTSSEKKMMNEQVKAYQEQTNLAKEELNRAKDAKAVEQRRIQEKQIRALRGSRSSQGFLGTSSGPGLSSQLGG